MRKRAENNSERYAVVQPLQQAPKVLCDSRPITFATLDGLEIHAAENHGERHSVDFDAERSGVHTARRLKVSTLQTLCPNDKPVTIPEQNLASIARPIEKDEVIALENVLAKGMRDQCAQSIEMLSHVSGQCMHEDTSRG